LGEKPLVPRWHIIRRTYDWVLHWAETPYGAWALFLLAFVESSFFPVPPDVLLIALTLPKPKRWLRYALICSVGSVLGGIFGYVIGIGLWGAARPLFIPYVFSQATFDRVVGLYAQHDFWIVFIAAFTPIPYKAITITAGVCRIDFAMFLLASVIGRSARFFMVAALIRIFGARMRTFTEKYFDLLTVAFTLLLIGGFVIARYWQQIWTWI